VNVLANYVLIFGAWGFPEMGIAGAGWGTVIGAVVNALTRAGFFVGPSIHRQFHSRATWRLDVPKAMNLVRIGAPAGFAMCVNTAVVGAILFRLIGRFGAQALAATSAVYSCTALSFMPVIGLGIALTATVGKAIGRGNLDVAVAQTRLCLRLALAYMGIVGLFFFLFRHTLIGYWSLSPDAGVLGARLLICAAIFQVFDAAVLTYSGALRGAGDTLWLGLITCLGAACVLGGGGWLMVHLFPQWNAIGPWIAYTLHVVFAGLALRWRFRRNLWQEIDILREHPPVTTPSKVPKTQRRKQRLH
jgi:MATE family multidrug resistance protein